MTKPLSFGKVSKGDVNYTFFKKWKKEKEKGQ